MSDPLLLFLDFDGVICDSLNECIISSFYAYFRIFKKNEPASLPLEYKKEFSSLRPYVRNGEDYLVIQHILENNIQIKDQAHFDEILGKHKEKMVYYKEFFYKARTILIENETDFWFNLNRIYPHILTHLARISVSPFFYILSTKRLDFILTILKNNNITIREDQVLVAWDIKKLDFISSILDTKGIGKAIFIDDQIDHLINNKDKRITPYLASWGYIRPEWLHSRVKVMGEDDMRKLMKQLNE